MGGIDGNQARQKLLAFTVGQHEHGVLRSRQVLLNEGRLLKRIMDILHPCFQLLPRVNDTVVTDSHRSGLAARFDKSRKFYIRHLFIDINRKKIGNHHPFTMHDLMRVIFAD